MYIDRDLMLCFSADNLMRVLRLSWVNRPVCVPENGNTEILNDLNKLLYNT